MKIVKNLAFTLAETLVVMGIIGVIAALTIPNLSQSTGNRERVTKVKKLYSDMNETLGRAQAIYGPAEEWFGSDTTVAAQTTRFGQRVGEFMKLSKVCNTTANKSCFNGNLGLNTSYYKFVTADGTSVLFTSDGNPVSFVGIYVGIDGPKGKTITDFNNGKDAFRFSWSSITHPEQVKPDCAATNVSEALEYFKTNNKCGSWWIVNFDNADYLKFPAGTGKCPNDVVPTDSNPRCN